MSRLFVAAAEASGDRLGAALVDALRSRTQHLEVAGLAGPAMRAAGVRAVARAEDATALGLVEVVTSVPRLSRLLDHLEAAAVSSRPDLVVTIDSPELLLRLARRVRRRGIPVVHWVSPQVWAWRPGRVRTLASAVDTVLCLLPFEPALYAGHVRAVFTGHPAAAIRAAVDAPRPGQPTFALCPGSRPSEVRTLWPVLRRVARRLRERHPHAGFVVPVAPTVGLRSLGGLDAVYVDGLEECAGADAAVVASGTATLELAALGVPMVVVYRVHPATWMVGRALVRGVRHVALPNVLAGRGVVPEILQDLDPERIAAEALAVMGTRQVPDELLASLGGEGAVDRAADEVAAWLRR